MAVETKENRRVQVMQIEGKFLATECLLYCQVPFLGMTLTVPGGRFVAKTRKEKGHFGFLGRARV